MSEIFTPAAMPQALGSTLPLTLLLVIGLVFFLRAASKDRTTVVEIRSSKPPLEVLPALAEWLQGRGWVADKTNPERRLLTFTGQVEASGALAVLLSVLGGVGAGCLGLVLCQLLPDLAWWPLLLTLLGPLAGVVYRRRAARPETVELRLISHDEATGSALQMRAHRDELIALEQEIGPQLGLFGVGDLLHSPI